MQPAARSGTAAGRWLLLTQDRVGSGLLQITHDFLATMLGTDRPSVSLAAGTLQKKRIIEYAMDRSSPESEKTGKLGVRMLQRDPAIQCGVGK